MSAIKQYFSRLKLPESSSHKGQNGKLMIIGGSDLFHAASKWSLDVASKFVDMVFYSSVPSNNDLIHQVKTEFWNGIVVKREEIESYIDEADCILIGPGMERQAPGLAKLSSKELSEKLKTSPTEAAWNNDTELIVNYLVNKYPQKKWVIDAGALQMIVPSLLNENIIITPHKGELERLEGMIDEKNTDQTISTFEKLLATGVAVVLKGPTDYVYQANEVIEINGGNPGMTKGGTGDVLAGLIAALYCTNDKDVAAVVGSFVNKKAGESLAEKVGPFFNASDLVQAVPEVLWKEYRSSKNDKG